MNGWTSGWKGKDSPPPWLLTCLPRQHASQDYEQPPGGRARWPSSREPNNKKKPRRTDKDSHMTGLLVRLVGLFRIHHCPFPVSCKEKEEDGRRITYRPQGVHDTTYLYHTLNYVFCPCVRRAAAIYRALISGLTTEYNAKTLLPRPLPQDTAIKASQGTSFPTRPKHLNNKCAENLRKRLRFTLYTLPTKHQKLLSNCS